MDTNHLTPIPKKHSINQKIIVIIGLIFLCYIPTVFIQSLVDDRLHHQQAYIGPSIGTEIAEQRQQFVQDPDRLQLVSDYRAITRVTKYSLLFITLTFSFFFLFEVLTKSRIHPINYGLVGLALGVFYLLLLSFSEQIGFISAYVIAAAAVVGLICMYVSRVLKNWQQTGLLGTLLIVLYGYLLVLLQLEQYSLLFGSLLVFATLATIMLSTRDIDWYDV